MQEILAVELPNTGSQKERIKEASGTLASSYIIRSRRLDSTRLAVDSSRFSLCQESEKGLEQATKRLGSIKEQRQKEMARASMLRQA